MRIILASTSRYRRQLLDQAGLVYEAAAPDFVEEHAAGLAPDEVARTFARGKAESLRARFPDALILGSDQVPAVDGDILTKPGSAEAAVEQLMRLQGREHRLITAVALHDARRGLTLEESTLHTMRMRAFTRAQAENYVAADQPLDCAGAYRIEARGPLLFESMLGSDHTAIIGLPLTVVGRLLRQCGIDLLGSSDPAVPRVG